MKTQRENEKDEEIKDKTCIIISPHAVKTIMLTCTNIHNAPHMYFSILSFSSPNHSNHLTSLTKKFGDDIQKRLKGFHLLRGFSQTNNFIPKYSFQTWLVCRTHPYELPKLNEHKLASHIKSRNISIFPVNKLTMLFTGVLNSMLNSFQFGGHDTTQLDKQMAKDTTNSSQLGQ